MIRAEIDDEILTHLDVSEDALMLKNVDRDWLAIHLPTNNYLLSTNEQLININIGINEQWEHNNNENTNTDECNQNDKNIKIPEWKL